MTRKLHPMIAPLEQFVTNAEILKPTSDYLYQQDEQIAKLNSRVATLESNVAKLESNVAKLALRDPLDAFRMCVIEKFADAVEDFPSMMSP
jgi:hypothetical protein